MNRLDFTTELERIVTRAWQNEVREIVAEIDTAAEQFESALSQLYSDAFLADRWVPEFLQ